MPTKNDKYGMSNLAEAMKWGSVVTSVVGVMIVPALVGVGIDNALGTEHPYAILGAIVGFVGAMYGLLDVVKATGGNPVL